jgi:SAM-dependent methyltransferase
MAEQLSTAPADAGAATTVHRPGAATTVHRLDAATSRRVRDQLASGRPDIGLLWELCLRVEFQRAVLVDGLAAWLGPPDGLRILDSACGSGFPALDLVRRGYAVTCSDGSPEMLARFRRNAAAAGVAVRPRRHRWEELARHYAASFDVVMCRGSSLIYAGTWDSDARPSRDALERSVDSLVRCLRPGGRMYVDTTRAEDLTARSTSSRSELVLADGARVVVLEEVETDVDRRVRSWTTVVTSPDAVASFRRRSHWLPHDELVALLTRAGLGHVGPVDVPGERYQVFTGVTGRAGGRGRRG